MKKNKKKTSQKKRKPAKRLDPLQAEMKRLQKETGKKVNAPFIVHASPLHEVPKFPTHTHGLDRLGLPELFMNAFSFGPEGTCAKLNDAFDFLSAESNASYLEKILNGEIVEISSSQLHPKSNESYTYCFREVSYDFEAVKQAYPDGQNLGNPIRDAHIIQMWVAGDDFVLDETYYFGGETW